MQKLVLALGIFFLAIGAKAQKTVYDPNADLRSVTGFHGINVSGGIDLYLSNGDEAVAVSASEVKFRDKIKTEVENGILKIWYDNPEKISLGGHKELKAYVSVKMLDRLIASGGSDVTVEGALQGDHLTMNFSGGSDFRGKVSVKELVVDQSGGADVSISGKAEKLTVSASGGSDMNGYDLVTDICIISASGGSDITITANKELHAEASGASDVNWKGSAQVKKLKTSGAGSITPRS
jgi:hypothetical protein